MERPTSAVHLSRVTGACSSIRLALPASLSSAMPPLSSARRPAGGHDHAWLAQRRLHWRDRRLADRGKPTQFIITAVARKRTGFLWTASTQ
jgi:hypothetical protein